MLKVTVILSLPTWKVDSEDPAKVRIDAGPEVIETRIEFCCEKDVAYSVFHDACDAALTKGSNIREQKDEKEINNNSD